MLRVPIPERPDWRGQAAALGFNFHTIDGEPYWDERAYYRFTLRQIEDDIEGPTAELDAMCLEIVDRACRDEELLQLLKIPETYWELVRGSWQAGEPSLYGRMDSLTTDTVRRNSMSTMRIRRPRSMNQPSSNGSGWSKHGRSGACRRAPISTTAFRKN